MPYFLFYQESSLQIHRLFLWRRGTEYNRSYTIFLLLLYVPRFWSMGFSNMQWLNLFLPTCLHMEMAYSLPFSLYHANVEWFHPLDFAWLTHSEKQDWFHKHDRMIDDTCQILPCTHNLGCFSFYSKK